MARRSLRPHLNQIRVVGTARPYRRLGRPPARGHRAGHRAVQAPERARQRRGAAEGAGATDFRRNRSQGRGRRADRRRAGGGRRGGRAREGRSSPEDERGRRGRSEDEPTRDAPHPSPQPTRRPRDAAARARNAGPLEGTFDHGEEGYGLWLDPAIQDNPIYAEHWAGHRPVEVLVEEDRIVIRRTGATTERHASRRSGPSSPSGDARPPPA